VDPIPIGRKWKSTNANGKATEQFRMYVVYDGAIPMKPNSHRQGEKRPIPVASGKLQSAHNQQILF
jgi:hypothetical protein